MHATYETRPQRWPHSYPRLIITDWLRYLVGAAGATRPNAYPNNSRAPDAICRRRWARSCPPRCRGLRRRRAWRATARTSGRSPRPPAAPPAAASHPPGRLPCKVTLLLSSVQLEITTLHDTDLLVVAAKLTVHMHVSHTSKVARQSRGQLQDNQVPAQQLKCACCRRVQ